MFQVWSFSFITLGGVLDERDIDVNAFNTQQQQQQRRRQRKQQ